MSTQNLQEILKKYLNQENDPKNKEEINKEIKIGLGMFEEEMTKTFDCLFFCEDDDFLWAG